MSSNDSRRAFFLTVIYGIWALITAALGIPAAVYLLIPPKTRKSGEWVEAGDAAQLQPGTPEELTYRRNRVDGWKVTSEKTTAWVVKTSGNVVAFAPQCTHLGCAYHWDETHHYFLCPCHTSTFAIDGKVLSGPAPRPLDRFAVKVDNGKILIGPMEKSGGAA
jgi:menaquinol-cytochrome c reductase iron-sulfur subunit